MPSLDALPLLKSQFTVTTSLFPDAKFTQFSGLNDLSDKVTYPDGEEYKLFYLTGFAKLEPMTLTIPHDPENHADLILAKRADPCGVFTVTITPVRCNPNEVAGPSLNLLNCRLTQVQAFEVNRNNTEMAVVQWEFVADDYNIQP